MSKIFEYFNENFGDALSQIMNEKGLTKKELAELTGLTPPTICRYVNGTATPTYENLKKLEEVLGYSFYMAVDDEKPEIKTKSIIDIHKLIDESMEKKDRYVSIFIGEGVTVNVYPVSEDAEWVVDLGRGIYICPSCEHSSGVASQYCSHCGEKLRRPKM